MKTKIILMKPKYLILFILTVIIVALTTRFCISFANENAEKKMKKDFYKGVITEIYQEPMNHNRWAFAVKIDSLEKEKCAECFPYSWEYACIGDSIIKPPDTLMIVIKKPNGESKEFFYRF